MLYAYNIETGEYSMTMPFETELSDGKTDIKPPKTEENQVAVFDTEKQAWEVFNDYRFTHKMIKGGEVFPIEDFGEIPSGYKLITNAEADEIEEQNRVNKLTMTRLDFINFLVANGLTLEQIDAYLNANISVRYKLMCCSDVFCGVAKSLMPITVGEITITADMVETAFKEKYSEL